MHFRCKFLYLWVLQWNAIYFRRIEHSSFRKLSFFKLQLQGLLKNSKKEIFLNFHLILISLCLKILPCIL